MDELYRLLATMINVSDELLGKSTFNDLQRKFLVHIYEGAIELRDLFLSFPDFTMVRAQEVISFEAREQLTGIIGYAEVLLDETDGELTSFQRAKVHDIRSAGKELIRMMRDTSEED